MSGSRDSTLNTPHAAAMAEDLQFSFLPIRARNALRTPRNLILLEPQTFQSILSTLRCPDVSGYLCRCDALTAANGAPPHVSHLFSDGDLQRTVPEVAVPEIL